MNGAEALARTLVDGGVRVCFANPGTSEMHFVSALDRVTEMRAVLCLHETVVTGAADGYARMAGGPAATLLHLGPGLGNGFANLHNAKRARSPMVNIVGEHALRHIAHDAPLTSDIEGTARPVSHWVRTSTSSAEIATDAALAIRMANSAPGQIATLILPADVAWSDSPGPAPVSAAAAPETVDDARVAEAAALLSGDGPTLLLIGHHGLGEAPLRDAARIKAATGCDVMAPMSNARVDRGRGRLSVERVPYPVPQALERLKHFRRVVLVGCKEPVAFFGYPNMPSRLLPENAVTFALATPEQDLPDTLARLAEHLRAPTQAPAQATPERPGRPSGRIDSDVLGAVVARHLPEDAIVADESVSVGRGFFAPTVGAAPHTWLQVTGGSIGLGLPLATGAAIACPDRRVVSLEADGSAMYCLQALWTQAREGLDVTTVIIANRAYAILQGEMKNVGATVTGGNAENLMALDRPVLDFVKLAEGMGVPAVRVEDGLALDRAFEQSVREPGPRLIEAVL